MNKLIPLSHFSELDDSLSFLSTTQVVVDTKGRPLGFVFGRDAFITLLTRIDDEFEQKAKDQKSAFFNPAGKIIDMIEEHLPVKADFIKDLKKAKKEADAYRWIPLVEVIKTLKD